MSRFDIIKGKTKPEPESPKTLDECLAFLKKRAEIDKSWDEFKAMPEEDAVTACHHTTGQGMRNGWGLWKEDSPLHQWFLARGIFHADDMSSIILKCFHRTLNGKPIDLEGQIKYYLDYWKREKELHKATTERLCGKDS